MQERANRFLGFTNTKNIINEYWTFNLQYNMYVPPTLRHSSKAEIDKCKQMKGWKFDQLCCVNTNLAWNSFYDNNQMNLYELSLRRKCQYAYCIVIIQLMCIYTFNKLLTQVSGIQSTI